MQTLADKVVVITGASRGIGAAIAAAMARERAKLVLCGRNKTRLKQVAKSLAGAEVVTISADITRPAGMKTIATTAVKHFGHIDIFINNAGVGLHKPLTETTEKEFDTIFDTNLKAVFFCFRVILPIMRRQGFGQIINISSMAGKQGVPGLAAYSASKAAMNVLSEAVAGEVRNDNIKVSVLAPASVETNFMSNLSKRSRTPSRAKQRLSVEEVADAVVFMAGQNENAWLSLAEIR
ncbi:MAG: SDR family oxidoreductase, partial [Candidatus Zixiibacteriota bacterium]